jgi:hypothetical protein
VAIGLGAQGSRVDSPLGTSASVSSIAVGYAENLSDNRPIRVVMLATSAVAATAVLDRNRAASFEQRAITSHNPSVEVLVIRGHFQCLFCSFRVGSHPPRGTVAALVLSIPSLRVSAFGLGRRVPRYLSSLGRIRPIAVQTSGTLTLSTPWQLESELNGGRVLLLRSSSGGCLDFVHARAVARARRTSVTAEVLQRYTLDVPCTAQAVLSQLRLHLRAPIGNRELVHGPLTSAPFGLPGPGGYPLAPAGPPMIALR